MDFFEFLAGEGSSRPVKRLAGKRLPRNGLPPQTKRKGLVVAARDASILFFDDDSGREVFLPVSTITDWWFTVDGTKRGMQLSDLELNDEVTMLIPIWLAKKEKLQ